jgi:ribosomal protein S18 acetylase RimI-like enzyme
VIYLNIIEASWEIENLNRNTAEIIIESTDDIANFHKVFSMKSYEYVVAKVSNKNQKALQKLQKEGFCFIETQISLTINVLDDTIDRFQTVAKNINFEKVYLKDDLNIILDNITEDMFTTDRIALDPRFGVKVANQRYKNWIYSEFGKSNIEVFRINKKDKIIGFVMTNNSGSGEVNILLGGIYSKYQGQGYGYNIVYQPIKHYSATGKSVLKTKVSSNNMDVIRFYIALGYKIEGMDYILIKHMEENKNGK